MAANGLADLQKRIRAMGVEARREIGVALDRSADEMVATARSMAPSEDGTLRESIRQEPGAHELQRVIEAGGPTTTRPVREGQSAEYDYSLAVEYGTSDTPEQPYFWPSWRLLKRRMRGRVSRAVRAAAKKAGWQA